MGWITLTDYASKYKVSVSTLRRRIKRGLIPFQKDGGKYWVLDKTMDFEATGRIEEVNLSSRPGNSGNNSDPAARDHDPVDEDRGAERVGPSVEEMGFSTAKMLLSEIKKAYMTILQEKEEQIVSLKHELADLNTLVRALERENQRLQGIIEERFDAPPRDREDGPLL